MLTRLILRLPWFVSAPVLIFGAVALAAGANVVAGAYFERSFRDDIDPQAGVASAAPVRSTPRAGAAGASAGASSLVAQTVPADEPAVSPTSSPDSDSDTGTSGAPSAESAAPETPPAPGILAQGTFRDGDPGHNGKGTARIIRVPGGELVLRFEDFSVTNGPDLFVVLSTDPGGSRGSATSGDALNLGRLKATDGNINYTIPDRTDTTSFKSVIIYCRAFHVVFAVATIAE